MNQAMKDKQAFLTRQIEGSKKQQADIAGAIADLKVKRDAQTAAVVALRDKHAEHCKSHALEQSSDHEKIAREIASAEAKISGFETLIREKESELQSARQRAEQPTAELAQLDHHEKIETQRAEVERLFSDGKKQLLELWSAQRAIARSIAGLHELRDNCDPAVHAEAASAAEKLGNGFVGRYVSEIFTPAELSGATAAPGAAN